MNETIGGFHVGNHNHGIRIGGSIRNINLAVHYRNVQGRPFQTRGNRLEGSQVARGNGTVHDMVPQNRRQGVGIINEALQNSWQRCLHGAKGFVGWGKQSKRTAVTEHFVQPRDHQGCDQDLEGRIVRTYESIDDILEWWGNGRPHGCSSITTATITIPAALFAATLGWRVVGSLTTVAIIGIFLATAFGVDWGVSTTFGVVRSAGRIVRGRQIVIGLGRDSAADKEDHR
mmetsp:Transcript_7945/g.16665  ORF Transcript_7945/g.16665 Transcript_7945/m.16665 type:complete len:230 (+) Transcript_7945:251-940(+)